MNYGGKTKKFDWLGTIDKLVSYMVNILGFLLYASALFFLDECICTLILLIICSF